MANWLKRVASIYVLKDIALNLIDLGQKELIKCLFWDSSFYFIKFYNEFEAFYYYQGLKQHKTLEMLQTNILELVKAYMSLKFQTFQTSDLNKLFLDIFILLKSL